MDTVFNVLDRPKRKIIGVLSRPTFLNKYSPYFFFVELISVWMFGTLKAIPHLYASSGENTILLHQVLACFLGLQLLVNWFCIHLTDCGYVPAKHGSMPQASEMSNGYDPTSTSLNGHNLSNENFSKTMFPYWSWRPCRYCNRWRPPRCHHCVLCNKCILKRDHHCFFARNCIGSQNARHFAVFLFWSVLTAVYSFIHGVMFFWTDILLHASYIEILPFVTFVFNMFGQSRVQTGFLILMGWTLAYMVMLSSVHCHDIHLMIISGRTKFEKEISIHIMDKRTVSERLRGCFGKYWLLNYLVPLHMVFKEEEGPVHWPGITGIERNVLMEIATQQ